MNGAFMMNKYILVLVIGMTMLLQQSNAAERGEAFVSNQEGGVSVINLDTLDIERSIDVQGKSPRGVGVTVDGKFLVTANKDTDNISIINPKTGLLLKQVNVGKNPEFVRIYKNLAFISTEPSSTGAPPTADKGAKLNQNDEADDDKLPAKIAVVNLTTGKKIKEITGGPETEGLEFSKDGRKLIVTNEADNSITVHDIKTGKLLKTISTVNYGERPRGIKVAPNGQYYVSTLEYGNKFIILDQHFNVIREVATAQAPYGISFDRSGEHIYVAAAKDRLLQVFDTKSFDKVKEATTAPRCWHFSFTPDDKELLMACGKANSILVFDVDTLEKKKEILDKDTPWGIVTFPKSIGSLDNP
jgi:DNA-binding beta-propeller fold protein YncE